MPTSTSRLGLQQPSLTDAPSEFRSAITTNTGILDTAVTITSGLLAARPTSSLILGQSYYATDIGLWYVYNGSAWETDMLASPWAACTLRTGVTATGSPWASPQARLVGDMVFLRGSIALANTNNGSIITVPSAAYQPAKNCGVGLSQGGTSGGVPVSGYMNTSGVLILNSSGISYTQLDLSNASYYLGS